MKVWTRTAYAAGALVVPVVLTGCGSGGGGGGGSFADQSAQDIMKSSAADMKKATSLRVSGDITSGAQQVGLDMQITTQGSCQGTMRIGGGTAQIVSDGTTSWMKGDHAFWVAEAGGQASVVEKAVGDKWVSMGSNADLSSFCDLDSLLKDVDTTGSTQGDPVTKSGTDNVGGQDTVKLDGHDDSNNPMTVWIASDSPHYILKMAVVGTGDSGSLTLSDYDKPLSVKTPAPSEVVDLSSLGG